jgi:hypothetical protein
MKITSPWLRSHLPRVKEIERRLMTEDHEASDTL